MIGIYKITNKVNNKVYIGQSSDIKRRWRDHRSAAFNPKDNGYNYPLYKAIRKYGLDNFSFDILEECSQSDINEREIFYVKKYNAHGDGGYNQDDGGTCAIHGKLTKAQVLEIHNLLRQRTLSMRAIAEQFHVHKNTIKMINNGTSWIIESVSYPVRTKPVLALEAKCIKQKRPYTPIKEQQFICPVCGGPMITATAKMCKACDEIHQRKVKTRPAPLDLAKMIVESSFTQVGKSFGVDGNAIKKWCKNYKIPHKVESLTEWYYNQIGEELPCKPEPKEKQPVVIKKVAQINYQTKEVIATFESTKAAARYLIQNGSTASISSLATNIGRVAKGTRKTCEGFIWEYI